jgi:hypothetical protein
MRSTRLSLLRNRTGRLELAGPYGRRAKCRGRPRSVSIYGSTKPYGSGSPWRCEIPEPSGILHKLVCRRAKSPAGTFFLCNRPELEQIRRVIQSQPHDSTLRIAVLGCRSSRCMDRSLGKADLQLQTRAVDISPETLHIAETRFTPVRVPNWPFVTSIPKVPIWKAR